MESLTLSFNAVMPIFLLMLTGYVIRALGIADKNGFNTVNRLVFKVFLPTHLFYNIYKTEQLQYFDMRVILFFVIMIVAVFLVGYPSVMLLTRDNAKRGVMLQGFFRSNFAILGLPLISYILDGESSALASLLVAVVVPMFNVLAVVSLESFGRDRSYGVKKLVIGIVKNPLIIGCAIGVVFSLLKIRLPFVFEEAVGDISSVASPLAIIALGAGFDFSKIRSSARELFITVAVRLVIVPTIALTAAYFLGFRGETMACTLVAFASPVAVSSYSMAQQMGGDEQLASQVVVFSSALCLLTLFLWIFAIGYLGLF